MNTATKIDLEDLQSVMEALQKRLGKLDLTTKVDVAARLRAAAKTIEAIDTAIKEDIKGRLHGKTGTVLGEVFKASVAMIQCTRLDQKALKEDEPAIYEQYQKTGEQARVTFEAR